MKKIIPIFIVLALVFALSSCGSSTQLANTAHDESTVEIGDGSSTVKQ